VVSNAKIKIVKDSWSKCWWKNSKSNWLWWF